MTELPEDLVFSRHVRVRGGVLVIGAGAVGSGVAIELAYMGIDRLLICDNRPVRPDNIGRQIHGAEDVGSNKARALASRLRRERPWCQVIPFGHDFTSEPEDLQLFYAQTVDLVVAATDQREVQRYINRVCLRAEIPAVYPGIWVDDRVRDAEVGEVLWVLPGRHTPCYECAFIHRDHAPDAAAARGSRLNIQQTVLATTQVVKALLNPSDPDAVILEAGDPAHGTPSRNLIYIHGLTSTSPSVSGAFPNPNGLFSRNMEVRFPEEPCPACNAHQGMTASRLIAPPARALAGAQADDENSWLFESVEPPISPPVTVLAPTQSQQAEALPVAPRAFGTAQRFERSIASWLYERTVPGGILAVTIGVALLIIVILFLVIVHLQSSYENIYG